MTNTPHPQEGLITVTMTTSWPRARALHQYQHVNGPNFISNRQKSTTVLHNTMISNTHLLRRNNKIATSLNKSDTHYDKILMQMIFTSRLHNYERSHILSNTCDYERLSLCLPLGVSVSPSRAHAHFHPSIIMH